MTTLTPLDVKFPSFHADPPASPAPATRRRRPRRCREGSPLRGADRRVSTEFRSRRAWSAAAWENHGWGLMGKNVLIIILYPSLSHIYHMFDAWNIYIYIFINTYPNNHLNLGNYAIHGASGVNNHIR